MNRSGWLLNSARYGDAVGRPVGVDVGVGGVKRKYVAAIAPTITATTTIAIATRNLFLIPLHLLKLLLVEIHQESFESTFEKSP